MSHNTLTAKHSLWYIAGQGAIGSLCAANLIQHGHCVQQIVKAGCTPQPIEFVPFESSTSVQLDLGVKIEKIQTIDRLLVPLKAYQVIPFLQDIIEKLSPQAQVIISHNGLGTLEQATKLLGSNRQLYFCTTNNGAFKQGNTVFHAGSGSSFWGKVSVYNNSKSLSNHDMSQIFPNAEFQDNIVQVLWHKLLINSSINPLTAVFRVKNGALLHAQYQTIIELLVQEFVNVAVAAGLQFTFDESIKIVNTVIEQTSANTSSMLRDIENNRPTEIDHITGYLVTKAKELGVITPNHNHYLEQVKALAH